MRRKPQKQTFTWPELFECSPSHAIFGSISYVENLETGVSYVTFVEIYTVTTHYTIERIV